MMRAESILVTGSTGYLGGHVVSALLGKGRSVVALKRSTSCDGYLPRGMAKLETFDYSEVGLKRIFSENSIVAVVHCATCYGRNSETAIEILDANVRFPLNIMEAAVKYGCRFFLNVDTILPEKINSYALSKSQFRHWGQQIAGSSEIQFCNVRMEHFYGPGAPTHYFINKVINACLSGEREFDLTGGEQIRDFLYVDDAVNAIVTLLNSGIRGDLTGLEFEVGGGNPISLREAIELIKKITNSKIILNFGEIPYRRGELTAKVPDISPMRKLMWRPEINLVDGLHLTIAKQIG